MPASFTDDGYQIERGVLSAETAMLLDVQFQMLCDNRHFTEGKLGTMEEQQPEGNHNHHNDDHTAPKRPFGDDQVPESFSSYGGPIFDSLLPRMLPLMERITGRRLLPTYSYARIYYQGAILKRHTDRPSCQFSATLTIAHDPDAGPWPIFMKDLHGVEKEVILPAGDLCAYRGDLLEHWREPYQGQRQVQVFLHYVDAEGEHACHLFDRRPMLGLTADTKAEPDPSVPTCTIQDTKEKECKDQITVLGGGNGGAQKRQFQFRYDEALVFLRTNDNVANYFFIQKGFSDEELAKLRGLWATLTHTEAKIGANGPGVKNPKVRRTTLAFVPKRTPMTKWIYEKVMAFTKLANDQFFQYEIVGSVEDLQMGLYKSESEDFYDWHIDVGHGTQSCRKLSIVVQLTPPEEYEGGTLELFFGSQPEEMSKEPGNVLIFPSTMLHRVRPVTRGERMSLVTWIHGPPFR